MKKFTAYLILSIIFCPLELLASDSEDMEYDLPLTPQSYVLYGSGEAVEASESVTAHNPQLLHEQKDLYYRDFNSLSEAEEYSIKERQANIMPEKIIGFGDRRRILGKEIQEIPWKIHFFLEIYYANANGKTRIYHGSATLITYNILLTAGHNLYDRDEGGYPDRIECFGACYDNKSLTEATIFPKKTPGSVFIAKNFENSGGKDQSTDIGLIIFDKEIASIIQQKIGMFANPLQLSENGWKQIKDNNVKFSITGYPGKRVAYTMHGIVEKLTDYTIKYDIDTEGGQSGSGIWFKNKGVVSCIGIHTYAGSKKEKFNIGILLNNDISNKIRNSNIILKEEQK